MAEEYIEKISKGNFIIRVNLIKGSYMVFKENEPIINPKSKTQSIVHELSQVIFLGKEFEMKLVLPDRIGFFDVVGGQVYVPFWIKGTSDVRHIKLPAHIQSDILPVYVYNFQSYHFGSIPASVTGMNYFVVDSRVDREVLIRLKMHFPLSRIIVYRGEQDAMIEPSKENDSGEAEENVRAADMVKSNESAIFEKNPAFAARVFLRKLEFSKMYELPLRYKLNKESLETILAYLHILNKKSSAKTELRNNINDIENLTKLFEALAPFLSFDIMQVEKIFDTGIPDQKILTSIRDILRFQMEKYRSDNDPRTERFFSNAMSMIEPLL